MKGTPKSAPKIGTRVKVHDDAPRFAGRIGLFHSQHDPKTAVVVLDNGLWFRVPVIYLQPVKD